MLKLTGLLLRLAVIGALVIFVASAPGTIEMEWRGYIIETTVGFVAVVLVIAAIIWTGVYRLWRSLLDWPRRRRERAAYMRHTTGIDSAVRALALIGAGDADGAARQSRRALTLLPEHPLALLTAAQAAALRGDTAEARQYFGRLKDDPSAAVLGVRGLLQNGGTPADARDSAVAEEALRILYDVSKTDANAPYVLMKRFEIETRQKSWTAAEKTLKQIKRAGVLDAGAFAHMRAVLYLAESDEALFDAQPMRAVKLAKKAVRLERAFVPAITRLARAYIAADKRRAAIRLIEQRAAEAPHPDLVAIWLQLEPEPAVKAPFTRDHYTADWLKKLYQKARDSKPVNAALGRSAYAAKEYDLARTHLRTGEDFETLSQLERGLGNIPEANMWLERALHAEATSTGDDKWHCASCGAAALDWAPNCHSCGSFASYQWSVVPCGVRPASSVPGLAGSLDFSTDFAADPRTVMTDGTNLRSPV